MEGVIVVLPLGARVRFLSLGRVLAAPIEPIASMFTVAVSIGLRFVEGLTRERGTRQTRRAGGTQTRAPRELLSLGSRIGLYI